MTGCRNSFCHAFYLFISGVHEKHMMVMVKTNVAMLEKYINKLLYDFCLSLHNILGLLSQSTDSVNSIFELFSMNCANNNEYW